MELSGEMRGKLRSLPSIAPPRTALSLLQSTLSEVVVDFGHHRKCYYYCGDRNTLTQAIVEDSEDGTACKAT
jgi:hypothetical protein